MKRLLILAAILASYANAGVYLTPRAKTYHAFRDCIALARSQHVLEADEHAAQEHGLTLCGICAHRHRGKVDGANTTWAAPEKEMK